MKKQTLNCSADVLIVGAGLCGASIARVLAEHGKIVAIYDRRNHIGGNMYDYIDDHGILVHQYGPHTFHTKDKSIYDYICSNNNCFVGKLNQNKIEKSDENNFVVFSNSKSDIKTHLKELINSAYVQIKEKEKLYYNIFKCFNENNNFVMEIISVFPNVNFNFKQINNLSFSNTKLNNYLINGGTEYSSGFLTMSQKLHLIALKDDIENNDVNSSKSLREIIFGIWICLPNQPLKCPAESQNVQLILSKYSLLIYQKCFKFIQISQQIPNIISSIKNSFILIVFHSSNVFQLEATLTEFSDKFKSTFLINKHSYCYNANRFNIPLFYKFSGSNLKKMEDFLTENDGERIKSKKESDLNEVVSKDKILGKDTSYDNLNENINNILHDSISDIFSRSIIEDENIENAQENEEKTEKIQQEIKTNNIVEIDNNILITKPNNFTSKTFSKIAKNSFAKQAKNSHTSTNSHSNKPSLLSSKNSLNNNNNSENLLFILRNKIKNNSEKINFLNDKMVSLEEKMNELIHVMENNNNNNNNINHINISNNGVFSKKNNTNKSDVSISIPHINYKEISVINDDDIS